MPPNLKTLVKLKNEISSIEPSMKIPGFIKNDRKGLYPLIFIRENKLRNFYLSSQSF